MRKAHEHKVSQIFFEDGYGYNCLDKIKLPDKLAYLVVSEKKKKEIKTHTNSQILRNWVYKKSKVGVN